jgi:UDP-N-acetylmuramoylalanine--D-glutamate ligase
MNIDNISKACIVGWGKTGIALANTLLSLRKKVMVTELSERNTFPNLLVNEFMKRGVKFEFGGHSEKFIKHAQIIILSPGVDLNHSSILNICRALNIPYVGEVEFSFWLTKAKFIAITATNGKTTTSFLTYRVLREKKKRVFLGGNIGIPLSSFVLNTKGRDLIVLEVSSFQLETILEFRPYVACLINVEPDHLNRYTSFKNYFEAKMNVFKNQKNDDWALLNRDIKFIKEIERRLNSKIVYFSSSFPSYGNIGANENFSCVYKIASIFGVPPYVCFKVFSNFKGLPHRLEFVRKLRGVTFINDSKSTTPSSTIWALNKINTPVILIAGGRDKGIDYSAVKPYLKRVKKINLFGESAHKIKESLNSSIPKEIFSSLHDTVVSSFKEANLEDTVLFSPMCSSFDMFSSYVERGRRFKEIVNSLK